MANTPTQITLCEGAFSVYLDKFPRMTSYTAAVTPYLLEHPDGINLFIDSSFVLMMAWHENFLKSLYNSSPIGSPNAQTPTAIG